VIKTNRDIPNKFIELTPLELHAGYCTPHAKAEDFSGYHFHSKPLGIPTGLNKFLNNVSINWFKLFLLLSLLFPGVIYSSELYTIQAGAFSTRQKAQDFLKSLGKNGIACALQESTGLYKVYCCEFTRKSDANALKTKLIILGHKDVFIVSKDAQSPQKAISGDSLIKQSLNQEMTYPTEEETHEKLPEQFQETVIKPADTKDVKIAENETIKPEISLKRKDTTVIPRIIVDSPNVTSRKHSTDNLFASDEPFTGPGNRGLTGLMEIPTARVMREDSYRFGITMVRPYWYYYIGVAPFGGLEIFGRVTRVEGVTAGLGKGYGDFKDRALELKYQVIPEGKWHYGPPRNKGLSIPIHCYLKADISLRFYYWYGEWEIW
jgi:hypothetical protein